MKEFLVALLAVFTLSAAGMVPAQADESLLETLKGEWVGTWESGRCCASGNIELRIRAYSLDDIVGDFVVTDAGTTSSWRSDGKITKKGELVFSASSFSRTDKLILRGDTLRGTYSSGEYSGYLTLKKK